MAEVGFCVPNLFFRPLVEAAIRSASAKPVPWHPGQEPVPPVVVLDLEAIPPEAVAQLCACRVQVLAFAPHTKIGQWASLRRAGAVILAKSAFFAQLPQLLAKALEPSS